MLSASASAGSTPQVQVKKVQKKSALKKERPLAPFPPCLFHEKSSSGAGRVLARTKEDVYGGSLAAAGATGLFGGAHSWVFLSLLLMELDVGGTALVDVVSELNLTATEVVGGRTSADVESDIG